MNYSFKALYWFFSIKENQFSVRFLITVLFVSIFQNINAQPNFNTIKDEKSLFEIKIPSGWNIKQSSVDSSFMRLSGASPKKDIFIDVYSWEKNDGKMDLTTLIGNSRKAFHFLGYEIERKKINDNKYEVFYNNKNKYSEYDKVVFLSQENYYYILVFYSKINDFSKTNEIIETFKINVPIRQIPEVDFWESVFGKTIFCLIIVTIIIGLISFSNLVLRKSYYNIKNAHKVIDGIKNKNENYGILVKQILEKGSEKNLEKANQFITGDFYQLILKDLNRNILVFTLSAIALLILIVAIPVILPVAIPNLAFKDLLTLLIFVCGEITCIYLGFNYRIVSAIRMFFMAILKEQEDD